MTSENAQKPGEDGRDTALSPVNIWARGAQTIAMEMADYSRKSAEFSAAAWQRLMSAKTIAEAMGVQSDYLKSSYQGLVAEMTILGDLYADLAAQSYKGFEGALARLEGHVPALAGGHRA
jgi:hypothetical protein